MIYNYDEITTIHFELTDKCNARCGQCGRTIMGGKTNPKLPLVELSLKDIQTMLPVDFVKHLKRVYMCGNYGDPIIAKDTIDILEWLQSINPSLKLGIHTNGSARTTEWWSRLGKILSGSNYVRFGLDGLADTNHLYRRDTNWNKIMKNVKAFIAAGGNAQWDYIVFRHNEHQIEEARQLANELGFTQFQVKKTGRFFSNTKMAGKDKQEVLDRNGNIEYYLEKPLNPNYQNQSLKKEEEIIKIYTNMINYLDKVKIDCKVAKEKSIYISAEGLVFPCCWTANQMYLWYAEKTQITELLDSLGGKDIINAKQKTIKEILEGPFFSAINNAWSKPSCASGKLKVCAKTCGSDFDPFRDQFK